MGQERSEPSEIPRNQNQERMQSLRVRIGKNGLGVVYPTSDVRYNVRARVGSLDLPASDTPSISQ